MLLALELEPVGVTPHGARLHAQQGVVRIGVRPPAVVAVVRRDERRPERPGDRHELRVRPPLGGEPVVLQLDEHVLPPEDVLQPPGERSALCLVAAEEGLQDDAAEASRRRDEALVVALEQLPVDAGLVVVALQVGGRRELHEVAVAGVRLGEQRQVVVELLPALTLTAGVVDAAPAAPGARSGSWPPCRPRSR